MTDFFDNVDNYLQTPGTHQPPEHNFTLNFFDWEDQVILNAVEFFTLRFLGQGKRERREFKTLKEAIDDVGNDFQCTVNCLTNSERSTCIERKHWAKYLQMFEEKSND